MSHCGMQQNVLALQLGGTLFIFSQPIKHAALRHPEYGLQKLSLNLQGSSLKMFLKKALIFLVKQRIQSFQTSFQISLPLLPPTPSHFSGLLPKPLKRRLIGSWYLQKSLFSAL